MHQKQARAAVAKAFKARKVGLRKGHWRVVHPQLVWYVDLRSDGPAPDAALGFEVGAWLPALTAEPEGGAVDCSLLADVPLDTAGDVVAQVNAMVDRLESVSDETSLAAAVREEAFEQAHVDRILRERLGA